MNKIVASWCTKWSRGQMTSTHLFHTKIYADRKEPASILPGLSFSSKYDKETTDQILNVLNQMSVDDHSRYNITKGRLQKIHKYRNTNGPFERIGQVLQVDDFGVTILEKFIASIAAGPKEQNVDTQYKPSLKDLNNVTSPIVSKEKRSTIRTVTSICVSPTHVSWAKMESDGRLVLWDSHSVVDLANNKNDNPMMLHNLALKLRHILPEADAYVIEAVSVNHPPGGSNPWILQRIQLSMSLATLLATQFNSPTEDGKQVSWTSNENLYCLQQRIVPQLFDLLVGFESVSPHTVIDRITDTSSQPLECIAPMTINNYELDVYRRSDAVKKSALSKALLTAAAFLNLAVNHNSNSFKALKRRRQ